MTFHDETVRHVQSKRVQMDEIWSFTAAKQKNVPSMKKPIEGAGDTWTWTALDADSKLILQWYVGDRDGETAKFFVNGVAERLATRVQLTTDGLKAYLEAVEGAFGADVDYRGRLPRKNAVQPRWQEAITDCYRSRCRMRTCSSDTCRIAAIDWDNCPCHIRCVV